MSKKFRPPAPVPPPEPAPRPTPEQQLLAMMRAELSVRSETRPIPKPEEMAEYNAIVPGAAERFIKAWEAETGHRREMDKLQTNALIAEMRATTTDRRLGLWLSFLLGGLVIEPPISLDRQVDYL